MTTPRVSGTEIVKATKVKTKTKAPIKRKRKKLLF